MRNTPMYDDRVDIRVLIEGVHVPYVSRIYVNHTESRSTATISLAPSPALRMDMLAGALVHIFYADRRVKEKFGDSDADAASLWPILFQGEVRMMDQEEGIQSSDAVIQCVSHSRHFEQTLMHFVNVDQKQSAAALANQKYRTLFIGGQEHVIETSTSGLTQSDRLADKIKERLQNISESGPRFVALTGLLADILDSADENAGYKVFDAKLKLKERISAYVDPDVEKILPLQTLPNLLEGRINSLPTYTSVKQMMEVPASLMQYHWKEINQSSVSERNLSRINATGISKTAVALAQDLYYDNLIITDDNNAIPVQGVDRGEYNDAVASINIIAAKALDPSEKDNKNGTLQLPSGNIKFKAPYFDLDLVVGQSGGNRYIERDSFLSKYIGQYKSIDEKDPDRSTKALQAVVSQGFIPYAPDDVGSLPERDLKIDKDVEEVLKIEKAKRGNQLIQFTATPSLEFAQPPRCNVFLPTHNQFYKMSIDAFGAPTRLFAEATLDPTGEVTTWFMAPSSATWFLTKDDGDSEVFSDNYRENAGAHRERRLKQTYSDIGD